MNNPQVPISVGEALDKITILEIKEEMITDKAAVEKAKHERSLIEASLVEAGVPADVMSGEATRQLYYVNLALWKAEDAFRASRETLQEHMTKVREFTDLAEAIPDLNRQRFDAKRAINEICGSTIMEVKQYHGEGA